MIISNSRQLKGLGERIYLLIIEASEYNLTLLCLVMSTKSNISFHVSELAFILYSGVIAYLTGLYFAGRHSLHSLSLELKIVKIQMILEVEEMISSVRYIY